MSNQTENTPLTNDEINQLAGAYARLQELRHATIQTPTSEAEAKGLVEFLAAQLLEHASELIGSVIVLRNEYDPLIQVFSSVVNRANAVIQNRIEQRAAALQQQKTASDSEQEATGPQAQGKIITLHP